MATKGSFNTSKEGNFYCTVSWERTGVSATKNEHYIKYSVVAHNTAGSYRTVYAKYMTINGKVVYDVSGADSGKKYYDGDVMISSTITIASSNAAGDGSIAIAFGAGVGSYPGTNISGSDSWTLDRIPRKFTSTPAISANSKTVNTYTFNWSTSETCSKVILYINNDTFTWTGSKKSGTITATGLNPATTYDVYIKCYREDSGLDSNSATKQYTTYQVGLISAAPNFNDEQNPTITYSNPSGNSVTSLLACIASNDAKTIYAAYRDIPKTENSYTFPLTSAERTALRKACSNATSLTVKFFIRTVSGGKTYNKYVAKTMTIKNGQPVFTNFNIEDVDAKILSLTDNPQKYVRKYSDIKVTILSADKMVAQKNSTAINYNVIVGEQSKTLAYSTSDLTTTISNMDANKIEVYAVDSRGLQTPASKSLSIIDYKEVALSSIAFTRKNNVEETVLITGKGTWTNVDFGRVVNSIKTFAFRKKKKTENTWSEWFSLTDIFNINEGGTIANKVENEFTATTFDFGEEYNIEVKIEDELSSVTKTATVNSGKILMSALKEKGVCFGGIYDETEGGVLQLVKNNYGPGPTGGFNLRNSDIVNANCIWWADESTGHEGLNFLKQNGDKLNIDDYECLRGYRGRVWYGETSSLAFFDEAHPVGSYMITQTNTNPGDSMPGTWSLAEKAMSYKAWTLVQGTDYTLDATNADTGTEIACVRMNDTLFFRINLVNKVAVGDTALTMFTLNYNSIGIVNLVYNMNHMPGFSDGGEAVVGATLNYSTGVFNTTDVNPNADGGILAAGSSTVWIISAPVPSSLMLDSACNKFYWRRTK